MKRRIFLGALGAAAFAPRFALAQQKTVNVVVLSAGESDDDEPATRAFYEEMRRRGWSEGTNIAYTRLYGKGSRTYSGNLASSAAGSAPDLVVAHTGSLAAAVMKESGTVPVVFLTSIDPAAIGLVQSVARPGGNATGVYQVQGDSILVRYRIAKEFLPKAGKVGVIFDRATLDVERVKKQHHEAARAAHLEIEAAEFTNYEAVAKSLARFRRSSIYLVMATPSFTLLARRRELIALAERNGIVLASHRVEYPEAGALFSYGPEIADAQRRSAALADRILKGARAAEIPVERAVKSELVINQRVARQHGISVSKTLIQRADRLID